MSNLFSCHNVIVIFGHKQVIDKKNEKSIDSLAIDLYLIGLRYLKLKLYLFIRSQSEFFRVGIDFKTSRINDQEIYRK